MERILPLQYDKGRIFYYFTKMLACDVTLYSRMNLSGGENMAKYTTGEIAKLCDVSVRTVQYYDTRGILIPSELSEGGRRLYTEDDLKRMKIICFLRELDIPISTIGELFEEEHPEDVIDIFLQQQEMGLRSEISERKKKLEKLEQLQQEVKTVEHFSMDSIGDIAYVMENKKKTKRVHCIMLVVGIPLELTEWITLAVGIRTGNWWPFAGSLLAIILGTAWLVAYYYKNIRYICPNCHTVFKPKFMEMLFANHTPSTRKLTCTCCGHKRYCVETYGGKENDDGI